ncbi:MAG: NAD-dependent protein deacylase [Firmicutes bacterium HGW-Firmicutes-21]|nr:MAG: NAD-dependent protein deacylase [Firmicutes bacterium HGW-Firmicutes-21]
MRMNINLKVLIDQSRSIVFFGGAGVSTESGIPDFRSTDGLYNQKYPYPPEHILSRHFFYNSTEEFFRFYREKMLYPHAKPNNAHKYLASLEKEGKLTAVITQNIDNLHQMAGSECVLELHGSVYRNYCIECNKFHSLEVIIASEGVPRCLCGGVIKPDVVLYGEQLDSNMLNSATEVLRNADLLIIGGTSLNVYPAAGLINRYSGQNTVIINKSPTCADNNATLVICDAIGKVFAPDI